VAHIPCVHVIPGDVCKPRHFGILGFGNLNPQLFPEMILSEARDLLTCVSRRSTTMISSGLRTSETSTFNLHFPSKCGFLPRVLLDRTTKIHFGSSPGVHGFAPCVLLNRMTEIHFGSPGSRNLNSKLLLAFFFPEHFIWSTRSVDACPPTDRRSPTTSAIQSFDVRALACHITACLSICGGMHRRFGVTRLSPAILLTLTRNPSVKPWFGLWDRLGELTPV
jgi:hypothetical protein